MRTSYICPSSLLLAETVPGNEEDCPCTVLALVIRKTNRVCSGVWDWWDSMFEKTVGLDSCGLMVVSGPYIHRLASSCSNTFNRWDEKQTNTSSQLLGGVYLGAPMLLSPLTLALAYTYAQENPNMQLNYFVVTFSAKWLPLAMLAMTFVMASPQAALIQATGLVAAHAYDFLTIYWPQRGGGRQLIWTPDFVARAFAPLAGSATRRGAGTAFNVRPGAAAGGTPSQNVPQRPAGGGGGWTSGFGGGAWSERGAGRRLGGD